MPSVFYKPNENKYEADKARIQFLDKNGEHFMLLEVYQKFLESNLQFISVDNKSREWCFQNYLNYTALMTSSSILKQLERLMRSLGMRITSINRNSIEYYVNIKKAITSGFFLQVAQGRSKRGYLTCKDNIVNLGIMISLLFFILQVWKKKDLNGLFIMN